MEGSELGCCLVGLELDEEMQLLVGRLFISAGGLKSVLRPSLVCNSAAWLLLFHHVNSVEKLVSGAVAW